MLQVLTGQGVPFAAWVAALARDFRSAFDGFAMRTAKALALRGHTTACGIVTFFLVGHDSSLLRWKYIHGMHSGPVREKHFLPEAGAIVSFGPQGRRCGNPDISLPKFQLSRYNS